MSSADFFYISVGTGFWIIVAVTVFAGYHAVETMKDLRTAVGEVRGMAQNLEMLKNGIKVGVLTLVSNLLGKTSKGGGSRGTRQQQQEE